MKRTKAKSVAALFIFYLLPFFFSLFLLLIQAAGASKNKFSKFDGKSVE